MENLIRQEVMNEKLVKDSSSLIQFIINHDGSTTYLLENLFSESIDIELLSQGYSKINNKDWTDINQEERVMIRTVFLKGRDTGNRYVYATSYIRTNYLSGVIVEDLEKGEKGIGRLIQEYKLEIFREFIESKPIYNNIMRSVFETEEKITNKIYKIYMQSVPVMLITEYYSNDLLIDSINLAR